MYYIERLKRFLLVFLVVFIFSNTTLLPMASNYSGGGRAQAQAQQAPTTPNTPSQQAGPAQNPSQQQPQNQVVDDCDFGSVAPWKIAQSAFNWFGCMIVKGMVGIMDTLTSQIEAALETNRSAAQEQATKNAWSKFLTIANILFVIAFLVMILSTALDLGFVDTYTVKKLLPRIILAVILANLSFVITSALIDITNTIGEAVRDIIFSAAPPLNITNFGADFGLGLSSLLGIAIGAAIYTLSGSIFAAVPIVMTALFAIVVAFAIVLIRRVIILLLVILAPVALALWVIPGMDEWAKRWWKILTQMLMIYPFIMAFLAAGKFTAAIIMSTAQNPEDLNLLEAIAAFAVMVLPLFLLPTVFKLASSTIGNLTGMVNNKTKGAFDRGSSWAKERSKYSNTNMRREQEKSKKRSVRQQEQGINATRRIMQPGVRGWARRRELSQDAQTVLAAQAGKERLWVPQAEEDLKKTSRAVAMYDIGQHMKKVIDSEMQQHNNPDLARKAALRYVEDLSVATHDGDGNEIDVQTKLAAIHTLGNQKAGGNLERVQLELARTGQAELYQQALADGDIYGAIGKVSPAFNAAIENSMSQAALADARRSSLNGATEEMLAESTDKSWELYAEVDNVRAAQRLASIQSKAGSAAKLNPKAEKLVLDSFANNQAAVASYQQEVLGRVNNGDVITPQERAVYKKITGQDLP